MIKVSNIVSKYDFITKFQAFQALQDHANLKRIKESFAGKSLVVLIQNKLRDLSKCLRTVERR